MSTSLPGYYVREYFLVSKYTVRKERQGKHSTLVIDKTLNKRDLCGWNMGALKIRKGEISEVCKGENNIHIEEWQ